MSQELQLGKYEFFPYENERKDILEELENLRELIKNRGWSGEDLLNELIRREKRVRSQNSRPRTRR